MVTEIAGAESCAPHRNHRQHARCRRSQDLRSGWASRLNARSIARKSSPALHPPLPARRHNIGTDRGFFLRYILVEAVVLCRLWVPSAVVQIAPRATRQTLL